MQTVTTKAVLVAMPGQIFTFVATAGLAGTLTSITGSGTLTHDGSVYSSGTVGAVIAAGDEITIDVPPTGSITSMEIQQTLNVTGTTNLTDVIGPDQPGYLLGISAGGVIGPVLPPTELTASNILSLVDGSGSNVEVTESGGLLAFTAPDAPPLTAGEINDLVHPDSNVTVGVEADQLKLTVPEIPTTWNVSTLRSGGTTANYGLRSKADGTFELYALAPVGLYDSGGFLVAPIGLSEDLPREDPPEWGLTSVQSTTVDQDVISGVDVTRTGGTPHYDSAQQASSEWRVNFTNRADLLIQQVGVWFSANGDGSKSAVYELTIMDGATDVASTTLIISSVATTTEKLFIFPDLTVFPANAKLRLERLSGDVQVLPLFVGSGTLTNQYGIQTDWLARDNTGTVVTSAAYPSGLQLWLKLYDLADRIEAETLSATQTATTYDLSGMGLTRLDAPTSNIVQPGVQHCIIEVEALPHTHTGRIECMAFGVQQFRGQEVAQTHFGLLRDETGVLRVYKNLYIGNTLTGDALATLASGVRYRFEFTLATSNTSGSILTLTGVWRSSDGQQMLGTQTQSFPKSENPLFVLLSGGEGGLIARRNIDAVRPMDIRVHRWVEWRE